MTDYRLIEEGEGRIFDLNPIDGQLTLAWHSSFDGEDWCGEENFETMDETFDFIRENGLEGEDHFDFLFRNGITASLDCNRDQGGTYYYIVYEEVELG